MESQKIESKKEEFQKATRELMIRLWLLQLPNSRVPDGARTAQVKEWIDEVKLWTKSHET
jgi:hypothetical protein